MGILVQTVGIFKGCTPRIRLGAVGFLWKMMEFGGKNDGIWVKNVGIVGVSTQESMGRSSFWGKKWEFWLKLLGF